MRKRQRGFFVPFGGGHASGGLTGNERSVRIRGAAGAYFSRTFGTPTNGKVLVVAIALKKAYISNGLVDFCLLGSGSSGSNSGGILIAGTGAFGSARDNRMMVLQGGSAADYWNPKLRDPSAFDLHVIGLDTSQTNAADRARYWHNGVLQTNASSALPLDATLSLNAPGVTHFIGALTNTSGYYGDGVFTEHYVIDGYPTGVTQGNWAASDLFSLFFKQDNNGIWIPKRYDGDFGNNGSYLNFRDVTSTTTLAYDSSGNGNHWAASGISLTSGTTYDSVPDYPGNGPADPQPVGCYPNLNPSNNATSIPILSNGNLTYASASTYTGATSTFPFPAGSGRWYWEIEMASSRFYAGIAESLAGMDVNGIGYRTNGFALEAGAGGGIRRVGNSAFTQIGSDAVGAGTKFKFAFNAATGDLWFGLVGAANWYGDTTSNTGDPVAGTNPAFSGLSTSVAFFLAVYEGQSLYSGHVNAGQRPFSDMPPTGFKAPCTTNLPTPAILDPSQHHYVKLIAKSGDTSFVLPWDADIYDTMFRVKRLDSTGDKYVIDGLRGYTKVLKLSTQDLETTDANVLGISGTTVTLKSTLPDGGYEVECFKAGPAASRSTNTNGSITSTVSANTVSQFSIVKHTGTGSTGTIGHGLSSVAYFESKSLYNGASNWHAYHQSVGATKAVFPNNAEGAIPSSNYFNNTAPTGTAFTLASSINLAHDYITYCHGEVLGYSQFGNSTTSQPFIFAPFLPSSCVFKDATTSNPWLYYSAARNPYNAALNTIRETNAEEGQYAAGGIDINANGVKVRTTDAALGSSSVIHCMWAAQPLANNPRAR